MGRPSRGGATSWGTAPAAGTGRPGGPDTARAPGRRRDGRERTRAARRVAQGQPRRLAWLAVDERRTGGVGSRSHPARGGALQGDPGHSRQRRRTLAARGGLVSGRSRGGKAAGLSGPSAGQPWARQVAGRGDAGPWREQAPGLSWTAPEQTWACRGAGRGDAGPSARGTRPGRARQHPGMGGASPSAGTIRHGAPKAGALEKGGGRPDGAEDHEKQWAA